MRTRINVVFLSVLMLLPSISSAVNVPPNRDAYTSSAFPTTNFGTATTLRVSSVERTWIRFDVASLLPAGTVGSQVAKATLVLWVNTANTPGFFDVLRVTGPWTQGGITHATPPLVDSVPEATGVQVSGRSFTIVDLTPLVRDWVDGFPNQGIAIVPSPGSGISVRFDSRENTGTSHEPQLAIILSGNGDIPTGLIALSDGAGCPAGFSLVTTYNNKFLVASGTAGTMGGANTHSHAAGSYVGPSHTHTVPHSGWKMEPAGFGDGSRLAGNKLSETEFMTIADNISGLGGGGTITGTSAPADSRPEFMTILLCRKN